MKQAIIVISLAVVMIALPAMSLAKNKVDVGKREYDSNCAVCHGVTGKGNGPMAGIIDQKVSDLTVLSKNNGGVFPLKHVYDVIEGERTVKGHGTRDMPVWGREYRIQAAAHYYDVPYDAEAYVRARILALAEYINRLQKK
jgi:mono/diheme cytochrome c family protein